MDEGEQYLKGFGFYNVRLRAHGDTVRIEVDRKDMGKVLEHAEEIVEKIKALGFSYVTLTWKASVPGVWMSIFCRRKEYDLVGS